MSDELLEQAKTLFYVWFKQGPNSEQFSRLLNGLFEIVKELDPDWMTNIRAPPDLGVSVSDGMGLKDEVK